MINMPYQVGYILKRLTPLNDDFLEQARHALDRARNGGWRFAEQSHSVAQVLLCLMRADATLESIGTTQAELKAMLVEWERCHAKRLLLHARKECQKGTRTVPGVVYRICQYLKRAGLSYADIDTSEQELLKLSGKPRLHWWIDV